MRGRVLFADNVGRFVKVRSEFLESSGFEVLPAYTLEEAAKLLKDEWIHLAILDIRMVDDNDDRDISGLTLAKDNVHSHIPKIILTGFPTYEAVREALGPTLDGLPPAVAFLAKKEGPQAMLQTVERILTEFVHINRNLAIYWEAQLSFLHLTSLIEPEIDSARLPDRASELEDLFRRLFFEYDQITVTRLFSMGKKRVALAVSAFSAEGAENLFIVVCGQRDIIQQEDKHFTKFAPTTMGLGSTAKHGRAETIHFAAIAYTLTGGDLGEITTLTEFYRQNSAEMVIITLDYLFNAVLSPWHQREGSFKEKESLNKAFINCLMSKESLTPLELGSRIRTIQSKALTNNLPRFDDESLRLLFDLIEGVVAIDSPLQYGLIYKQLQGDNILVDSQGRTWLIDFSQVGQGPLVYDYVSLETMVKFELLNTSSLQERQRMENYLHANFSGSNEDKFENLESNVQKALRVINYIRQRAVDVTSQETKPYQVGLLFAVVEKLRTYVLEIHYPHRELVPYVHILLSAWMLCQELNRTDRENNFLIDHKNKVIRVEEKVVELTKLQFKLLAYLMENQDHICSRDELLHHLYQEEEYDRVESALDAHISRLRQKVEPDPANPRYIITIPGHGYKFLK